MYDYLIVGAGLYGSVVAHELTKANMKCMVIDKRSHVGGNVYTEKIDDIYVHVYGAHIFHTSNNDVWQYIQQVADMNEYINQPIANYNGELYNLPFNMNTFEQMWGVKNPDEAKAIIENQRTVIKGTPRNLEEQAIAMVGEDIYRKLIKGYTEKQWGRKCSDLPSSIIKRLPVRYEYDNNYFNDVYQGIPKGGYTPMIEKLLQGSDVVLNTNFFDDVKKYKSMAKRIIYTGALDEYYDYRYGKLEYRSLRFETERLEEETYQGHAVVNYTDDKTKWTRIIEHKYFEYNNQPRTIITKEYPQSYGNGNEPYYAINDEKNNAIYNQYKTLADTEGLLYGGRLADYKYYDMDDTIFNALKLAKKIIQKK